MKLKDHHLIIIIVLVVSLIGFLTIININTGETRTELELPAQIEIICGDGICNEIEKGVCFKDCPILELCGNGVCDKTLGESYHNCINDCPSNEICGNGICAGEETVKTCIQDCGTCGDGFCARTEEGICYEDCGYCGDKHCTANEERVCYKDCGWCGDRACTTEIGETYDNCRKDCKIPYYCGDGNCDRTETKTTCPKDCGRVSHCGDGFCDNWESKKNCPQDCGVPPFCGDRKCDTQFEENIVNCFLDCNYCGDGFCTLEEEGICFEDCGKIKE